MDWGTEKILRVFFEELPFLKFFDIFESVF